MVLEEKHQKVAIEIVQKNRKKKSCNRCYDRGYIGFSQDKTIVPCDKCVDIEKSYEDWKNYVSEDAELREAFKELFTEETEEKSEDSIESENKEVNSTVVEPKASKPQVVKKEGTIRKEPHIKATKNTTVRKSGNR